jgi:hypothetical protein
MGGTKETVYQTPTTPAPSASQSSEDLYQARLKYDPQVAAMEQALAEQYYPKQAALSANLYQQYAPMMAEQEKQLREKYAPSQTALTEAFTQQAMQRLQNPYGETPEQSAAVEAIRQRETNRLSQAMRNRSNLGGNLYSGQGQQLESRALQELLQGYTSQDIARQQQGAQTALQYSVPVLQQLYPQTTYPGQPQTQNPIGQSVTPDASSLYQALYQASQPNYLYQQGSPSPLWGLAGSVAGGVGAGWANNFFK